MALVYILAALCALCLCMLGWSVQADRKRLDELLNRFAQMNEVVDTLKQEIALQAAELDELKSYAGALEAAAEQERRYAEGLENINNYDITVALNAQKNGGKRY